MSLQHIENQQVKKMTYEEEFMNQMLGWQEQKKASAKPRRKPQPKSEAVLQLERDIVAARQARYPGQPGNDFRKPMEDRTANGMTRCIITWLRLHVERCNVDRQNSTGVYRPDLGRFVQGQGRRGRADIVATINGRPWQIEVKAGRDRPRPDQLKMAEAERRAGGVYIFVHSLQDFIDQYNQITNEQEPVL